MILDFITWFTGTQSTRAVVSLRDILAWVRFMDACVATRLLPPDQAFVHGACLVFLDGLGAGSGGGVSPKTIRARCLSFMANQISALLGTSPVAIDDLEVHRQDACLG
jgi:midasin